MMDICQHIYQMMQDDISRKIYLYRWMYSISQDNEWLKKIVCMLPEGESFHSLPLGENDYIFGCGVYGQTLRRWFQTAWKGYVDNNYQAYPRGLDGLPVISPSDVPRDARVFLAVKYHEQEIFSQLRDLGILEQNIINVGKVLYDLGKAQYFDLPCLPHKEHEVFVDAGALNGETSQMFAEWSKGQYDHIYCFEPDERNIPKCEQTLETMNFAGGVFSFPSGALQPIRKNAISIMWKWGFQIGRGDRDCRGCFVRRNAA